MTSPAAILRMIRAHMPPLPRVGFVTAIDLAAQAVTVSMEDGATTSALAWDASLTPAVGDRVLVTPTTTGWVVTARVTAAPRLVTDETVTVGPVRSWAKVNASDSPWGRQVDQTAAATPAERRRVKAGRHLGLTPGGIQPRPEDWATVLYYGPLASLVPSGATIGHVSLTLYRPTGGDGPELVAPVLWPHTHTSTSPPVVGSAPAWAPGYPAVIGDGIGRGEEAVISIPPTWITAWLSGAITGIGLYSTLTQHALTSVGPLDNASLSITHTPLA